MKEIIKRVIVVQEDQAIGNAVLDHLEKRNYDFQVVRSEQEYQEIVTVLRDIGVDPLATIRCILPQDTTLDHTSYELRTWNPELEAKAYPEEENTGFVYTTVVPSDVVRKLSQVHPVQRAS